MKQEMEASIVVGLPAYNESGSIEPLMRRIKNLDVSFKDDLKILLFDDGSTDNTAAIFQENCKAQDLDGVVIGDRLNHGLGFGLRSILTYFVDQTNAKYLVIMDCDDTHDPEQISEMLQAVLKHDLEIVIASRYRKGSKIYGVSSTRKIISSTAGIYLRVLFPWSKIRDFTCGYRLYSRDSLIKLAVATDGAFFKRDGFSCMPEIILRLHNQGARIGEVPLILGYDRKVSVSKMKFFRNIREIVILGIQTRMSID